MPTKLITYMLSTVLLFISLSCSANEPQHNETMKLTLTVEDVTCGDAHLRLRAENINLPRRATLFRNDAIYYSLNIKTSDTIIKEMWLNPSESATYMAMMNIDDKVDLYSEKITVTTLDTTGRYNSWEMWEFGEKPTSIFYDVAIIDENNIWAVGEIYTKDTYTYDSLGNFIQPYNSAFWNGSSWELKRILYLGGFAPITAIHAFSKNDIWFGMGYAIHYDGIMFREKEIPNWHIKINKIWGISSEDLYIVGSEGSIAHYDGKRWSRIESPVGSSGKKMELTSIAERAGDIYICGFDFSINEGIILKYREGKAEIFAEGRIVEEEDLFYPHLYGGLNSIYSNEKELIVGGQCLFRHKFGEWGYFPGLRGNSIHWQIAVRFHGYIYSISGNSALDLAICGDRNTLMHYNGWSFKQAGLPYEASDSEITWTSVKMQGDVMVAVGIKGIKAAIMKLRR